MSDCVLWGFEDLLRHYQVPIHPDTHKIFTAMRGATLPAQNLWKAWWEEEDGNFSWVSMHYTYGGVAPWITQSLARLHGYDIVVQHRLWTPEVYQRQAQTDYQALVAHATGYLFGKEVVEIDLEPAIYLMLDGDISKHAQFFQQVPKDKGVCVMAIGLANPIPYLGVNDGTKETNPDDNQDKG